MITLRSIIFAAIAGINLGYSLHYFIHQGNIGNGIFWLVLFIIATITSILHFRRPMRYVEVHDEEDQ